MALLLKMKTGILNRGEDGEALGKNDGFFTRVMKAKFEKTFVSSPYKEFVSKPAFCVRSLTGVEINFARESHGHVYRECCTAPMM